MSQEFKTLQEQETWTLIILPIDAQIVRCKWLYKLDSNGLVARYKACLVPQGNKQEYGVDYLDLFSLVAKIPSFCIIFNIVINHKWEFYRLK